MRPTKRAKLDPSRHRQGCKVRLAPVRQRSLDRLVERRGVQGAALEIGVSTALVDSLAYGGRARAESVRVVSNAIGAMEGEEAA